MGVVLSGMIVTRLVCAALFIPLAYGISVAAKWAVAVQGPWIAVPIVGAALVGAAIYDRRQ